MIHTYEKGQVYSANIPIKAEHPASFWRLKKSPPGNVRMNLYDTEINGSVCKLVKQTVEQDPPGKSHF